MGCFSVLKTTGVDTLGTGTGVLAIGTPKGLSSTKTTLKVKTTNKNLHQEIRLEMAETNNK